MKSTGQGQTKRFRLLKILHLGSEFRPKKARDGCIATPLEIACRFWLPAFELKDRGEHVLQSLLAGVHRLVFEGCRRIQNQKQYQGIGSGNIRNRGSRCCVQLLRRTDHCQDTGFDRPRQVGPSGDDGSEVGIRTFGVFDSCAGFCAALVGSVLISVRIMGGFESCLAYAPVLQGVA
jgi:hypothetical protein